MAETAVDIYDKRAKIWSALYVNRLDNRSRLNGNNDLGNTNNHSVGIAQLYN